MEEGAPEKGMERWCGWSWCGGEAGRTSEIAISLGSGHEYPGSSHSGPL